MSRRNNNNNNNSNRRPRRQTLRPNPWAESNVGWPSFNATSVPMANTRKPKSKPNVPNVFVQAPAPKRKRNRTKKTSNPSKNVPLCAVRYASALVDPEFTPVGACVPYGFPVPTQKAKGYCSGRMGVGTTGQGFVLLSGNCGSDGVAATYTSITSVGTGATAMNAFTTLSTLTQSNLPYTNAQVSAQGGPDVRMISQILKIRYAGPEVTRNGTIYAFEQPQHYSIDNLSINNLVATAIRSSERPKMDGSWSTLVFSGPVQSQEVEFWGTNSLYVPTGNNRVSNGISYAAIMVNGTSGDLYDFEIFTQCEYSGSYLQGASTTEADPEAYGKVIEVMKAAVQSGPINLGDSQSHFSEILRSLGSTVASVVKRYGLELAKNSISQYLLPGANRQRQLEL